MDNQVTPEIVEQKKQQYLKAKQAVIDYLQELLAILKNNQDEPLSREKRKIFMERFAMLDHRLLDKLDVRSYEYFEVKESLEKKKS